MKKTLIIIASILTLIGSPSLAAGDAEAGLRHQQRQRSVVSALQPVLVVLQAASRCAGWALQFLLICPCTPRMHTY